MLARSPRYIWDRMTPLRATLLDQSLADFLPPNDGSAVAGDGIIDVHSAAVPLPLRLPSATRPAAAPAPLRPGQHLVYFPPQQLSSSRLLPDGTEPDHAPPSEFGFGTRVWAGGSVDFFPSLAGTNDCGERRRPLVLDGGSAVCREAIVDVRLRTGRGGRRLVVVDIRREYWAVEDGVEEEAQVEEWLRRNTPSLIEVRTLVFAREALKKEEKQGPRGRILLEPTTMAAC